MFGVWIVCNCCDGLHKPRNSVCVEALIQHFAALSGVRATDFRLRLLDYFRNADARIGARSAKRLGTTSRHSRVRHPLDDETLRGISPTSSQSRPSAGTAQGEFCPNQASPDNRVRIVYRNWAGFVRPTYSSFGQKRDESGVRHSSIKSNSPSTMPNSNFVSATMIPFCAACSRPRE